MSPFCSSLSNPLIQLCWVIISESVTHSNSWQRAAESQWHFPCPKIGGNTLTLFSLLLDKFYWPVPEPGPSSNLAADSKVIQYILKQFKASIYVTDSRSVLISALKDAVCCSLSML